MKDTKSSALRVAIAFLVGMSVVSGCAIVLDPTDGRTDLFVVVENSQSAAGYRDLAVVLTSVELVPCGGRPAPTGYSALHDWLVPDASAHAFESSDYAVRSVVFDLTRDTRTPWMSLQPFGDVYCRVEILAKTADEETLGAGERELVGNTYMARFARGQVEVFGTRTLSFGHDFERPFDPAVEDVELEVAIDAGFVAALDPSADEDLVDQLSKRLSHAVTIAEVRR